MMPVDMTELDAAGILAVCVHMVPVGARVDQAIAAHKVALQTLEGDPADPAAWDIAANTLRAGRRPRSAGRAGQGRGHTGRVPGAVNPPSCALTASPGRGTRPPNSDMRAARGPRLAAPYLPARRKPKT